MSHIALASLYLESFTLSISDQFTSLFQSKYESVKPARNGRHWRIDIRDRLAPVTDTVILKIFVKPTIEVLPDVEDDLLSLGYLPDELAECVTIVSVRGRAEDLAACAQLCELIQTTFGSATTGARLSS